MTIREALPDSSAARTWRCGSNPAVKDAVSHHLVMLDKVRDRADEFDAPRYVRCRAVSDNGARGEIICAGLPG
jgi:hypothetical protein